MKKSSQPLLNPRMSSSVWHVLLCVPLLRSFSDNTVLPDTRENLVVDQYTTLTLNVLFLLKSKIRICIAAVLKKPDTYGEMKKTV